MVISRLKPLDKPALIICLQIFAHYFEHSRQCYLLAPTSFIIRISIQKGGWDFKVFPTKEGSDLQLFAP